MATTWTSSALTTTNKYIKYKIKIVENSTSTSNNTSSVTVTVNFYRTNTGYTTYGSGTVYVTIDGSSYTASVTSSQKITSSGINLFSKTVTINHDSDGSKSLTVKAYISHSQFSSSSQSYTVDLTTIPRASTITSASAVTMDAACSVKFTPLSTSYYYKCSFTCGGNTVTTSAFHPNTTSAYTYTSYTFKSSVWAQYITTATSATCTVKLYTYSNSSCSTQIGSASSTTFTLKVPSTVVPSATATISEGNSDISSSIKVYLAGKSKLKVAVTATMIYSSPIASISVKVGSTSYTASLTTTSTGATGTITASAVSDTSVTITVTVKDKRGYSGTYTTTVTQVSYSAPAINTFTCVRCDEDGNEDTSGSYVKIVYKYTVTSASGNTSEMTLKWKAASATSYTATLITESSIFAGDTTTYITTITFSTESAFTFQLTVTDGVSSTVKTVDLSTALTIMDMLAGGEGLAIGKVAETKGLTDSEWPVKADGFMIPEIQYGTVSTTACPAGETTDIDVSFPKTFSGTPAVVIGVVSSTTTESAYADIHAFAMGISTTGFTLRCANGHTGSLSPAFRWIAMYAKSM